MPRTRFSLIYILALASCLTLPYRADAFWGFGSGSTGNNASGLDLVQGYDRNTVSTITGRVISPVTSSADPVTVDLQSSTELVTVVIGPRWYLQDDAINWKSGDQITVRGARAVGKDGKTYLLAQWLTSPDGNQLTVRSDTGRPAWSGGARMQQQFGSGSGSRQQRNGSGVYRGR